MLREYTVVVDIPMACTSVYNRWDRQTISALAEDGIAAVHKVRSKLARQGVKGVVVQEVYPKEVGKMLYQFDVTLEVMTKDPLSANPNAMQAKEIIKEVLAESEKDALDIVERSLVDYEYPHMIKSVINKTEPTPVELYSDLRKRYMDDAADAIKRGGKQLLIIAIELPNRAIETISNTQNIESKLEWYLEKYDNNFKMINNPAISVVGYMLV